MDCQVCCLILLGLTIFSEWCVFLSCHVSPLIIVPTSLTNLCGGLCCAATIAGILRALIKWCRKDESPFSEDLCNFVATVLDLLLLSISLKIITVDSMPKECNCILFAITFSGFMTLIMSLYRLFNYCYLYLLNSVTVSLSVLVIIFSVQNCETSVGVIHDCIVL